METASGVRPFGKGAVTRRATTLCAVALMLIAGAWLVVSSSGRAARLRSQHSQPAAAVPPPLVAITAEGKLYHRPDCAYIHGPARMVPGEQSIAEGYAPTTCCWGRYRATPHGQRPPPQKPSTG